MTQLNLRPVNHAKGDTNRGIELGDRLESIDIDPIVVLDEGRGAVALDALVVIRPETPGDRT